MIGMQFDWDEIKNDANIAKHSVNFEEAETVFYDERAIILFDEVHSIEEDRFVAIGRRDWHER